VTGKEDILEKPRGLRLLLAAAAVALVTPASAAVPVEWFIPWWGYLLNAEDVPLDGPATVRFRFYATTSAETALWESSAYPVTVAEGLAGVDVGPLPEDLFDGRDDVFASLSVNGGEEMVPRIRVGGELLARRARAAEALTGTAHCDCVKVAVGSGGLDACTEGRIGAGFYNECAGGGAECVSALDCCRVCQ
jgi:hypothetical protein